MKLSFDFIKTCGEVTFEIFKLVSNTFINPNSNNVKKIPSYTEEINPDNGYLIKNGIIQNTTDNILTITTENLNYKASQTYAIIVEFWINNK